ncbi:MAG: metallophosphoesterase, partial [Flavobacteriaceae bacterium]|nr:metallophosphoesterase [Flavobacteriaceae bacterium]
MRWLILLLIYFSVEFYAFQAIKKLTSKKSLRWLYLVISLLVLLNLLGHVFVLPSQPNFMQDGRAFAAGLFMAVFLPKCLMVILLFLEDIFRILTGITRKITRPSNEFHLPSRRKFVSSLALGIAALPFSSLLYGMYKGKYNFKVLKYVLEFDELPDAFHGYTLTQISDIHAGSLDDKAMVNYAVDLINEQQSNCIVFTGDLVNDKADELSPWLDTFKQLKAEDGVFSVLGNHDYGDYAGWPTQEAKEENFERIKNLQRQFGWDLLLNEHRYIYRDNQRIALVGVENWGEGGFKKAGDLEKATRSVDENDFKVLLSHDPSHWEVQILSHPKPIQLTLSGHTHGMQFGIEIPGWFKWSPVRLRYKQWAGIYENLGKYINVNRGLGFIGYPGRV